MKIAFFQQNPAWGACEEYFCLLIEGVAQARPQWELVLFCPEESPLSRWEQAIGLYAKIVTYKSRGPFSIVNLTWQIQRLRPTLIHINDPGIKGLAAARFAGQKNVVVTFHTPALNIDYNWKGKFLWKWGFSSSVQLIALSESNKRLLVEQYKFSPGRVTVIPHGLKSQKFLGPFNAREEIRQALGVPVDKTLLVNVGRLAPQKRQDVLIEAISLLPSEILSRLCLLIVGEGELRPVLERQVSEKRLQEIIYFAGFREDVPALLFASDIFVLSSDFEGLPFAVLEAMAMGKPIVATAVEGVRDVLEDRRTALLVPPQNPEALGEAIGELVADRDLARRLGESAQREFGAQYVQEVMVSRTLQLYERLLL